MSAYVVSTQFRAVDGFSGVVRGMTASTQAFSNKAQSAMMRVNASINRLIPSVFRLNGGFANMIAGFAGFGVLMAGGKAVMDYDKNIQSLSAITGTSGEALDEFKQKVMEVAKQQKVSAAEIADAFSLIGSAKPELLESADALAQVTEQAVILSKAGGMEVPAAADALTNAMNQFGVGAEDAAKFVDILATSQQKGTARIGQLSASLVEAGSVAKSFGLDFDQTNALLQGFAAGGKLGTKAGTQLAGVLSKLSKVSNKDFNPSYTNTIKIIDNLTKANLSYPELLKLTDAEGAKWLSTLISQNDVIQKLSGNLHEVGNAQEQAGVVTKSLSAKFGELKGAFDNAIIGATEGSFIMDAFSGILSFLADNMDTVLSLALLIVGALITLKAITIIITGFTWLYNVAIGVMGAFQNTANIAIGRSVVAMVAYKTATIAITAVTWLFNGAAKALGVVLTFLSANPIVLIIAGIVALIAGIIWVIKKFNLWTVITKGIGKVFTWLGGLWSGFVEGIKASLSAVVDTFKAIGKTVLRWLLAPIELFLEAVSYIPGVGGMADDALASIRSFTRDEETSGGGGSELFANAFDRLNTQADTQAAITERNETFERQQVNITVADETGRVTVDSDKDLIPVMVGSTT